MEGGAPLLSLSTVTYRHRLPNWRRPWKKRFGAGIHDVNLQVHSGSILGLIGPNGSGKTTLLHTIAGLNAQQRGDIRFSGQDREMLGWANSQRHIGLMPERVNWSGASTPHEVLSRLTTMRGEGESPENLLKIVGMSSRMHTPLDNMSQGMRQRLTLACALLGAPDILLLDEPLNGLDPVAQAAFRRLLRDLANRGIAIIVSSHNLHEMELFVDSLAILHRGQMIASGTLSEVEKILGCEPSLIVAGKGWCPPSADSFGRNVSLEKSDAWPDEEWRIILRKKGGWSGDEKHSVLKSIEEAGGEINLLQTVLPTLEDMLAAATGESADTVGLEVGDDSMIPLRKWEASEDE
ncbi:MAG: ABC transporter ATP-binding protein [Candidatus Thalassarchaeaceae archaeon]|nr:ABC transporter ATP-binding protein [Candidatus Thalassarchaeaceae archaeon]MDP7043327.1 ABC transporter ATP-binding protein [Candidatus Thalassarchaeaceae archaeon]